MSLTYTVVCPYVLSLTILPSPLYCILNFTVHICSCICFLCIVTHYTMQWCAPVYCSLGFAASCNCGYSVNPRLPSPPHALLSLFRALPHISFSSYSPFSSYSSFPQITPHNNYLAIVPYILRRMLIQHISVQGSTDCLPCDTLSCHFFVCFLIFLPSRDL